MQTASDGPETQILRPSKLKWIVILVISLAFAGLFGFLPNIRADIGPVLAMLGAGLFFAVSVISVVIIATDINALHLDRESFGVRTIWGTRRFNWQDVSAFRTMKVTRAGTAVGFDLENVENQNSAREILSDLNKNLALPDHLLPDTYNMDPKDLCVLLNQWRDRAL